MKAGRWTITLVVPAGPIPAPATDAAAASWTAAVGSDGTVEIDGTAMSVVRDGDVRVRVDAGGRQVTAHVVTDAGMTWVHLAGEVMIFEVNAGTTRAGGARRVQPSGLAAPMPATVRAVLVAPGDAVSAGDTLVMLEAMKMELPVRATEAGTVRAVRCTAGELVQPGIALVEIQ